MIHGKLLDKYFLKYGINKENMTLIESLQRQLCLKFCQKEFFLRR